MSKRLMSGAILNKKWSVNAEHALFHKNGTWFEVLKAFPGALFDSRGYVQFSSATDYASCPGVSVGEKTNVRYGIANLPNYIEVS